MMLNGVIKGRLIVYVFMCVYVMVLNWFFVYWNCCLLVGKICEIVSLLSLKFVEIEWEFLLCR